jgi:hypothetical protein
MCDSIANGGPRYLSTVGGGGSCPPANVIVASNVLDTTGNVIAGNVISVDGTFTGNLYVSGRLYGNITYNSLNVAEFINTGTIVSGAYYGNGYGLSNLNISNLSGLISNTNLPTTGVTSGRYGDFANVASIKIDQYGRITQAANVAILSSQWTTVGGNVAYQNGVSIGTLSPPPAGSNLLVLGTANIDVINAASIAVTNVALTSLNVSGISNLNSVTSSLFVGNASGLSNVNASNLVGNVANANVALVVSQPAQPNITSVGTLTGLNVSGISNLNSVTSSLFVGNASGLSNVNGANVSTVGTAQSVTTGGQPNITSVGTLTGLYSSGNITSTYFIGGGNAISNIQIYNLVGTIDFANTSGSVVNSHQPNITSLGTLTTLDVIGTTTSGTFVGAGHGLYGINGSAIIDAVATANSVVKASQPNITSLGTLTALTVSGLLVASNGSGISNINSSNLVGNVANANVALVVSQPAQLNITSVGTLTGLNVSGISNLNSVTSSLFVGNASGLSNINASNLVGNVANANVALVVSQPAQPNITSVGTLIGLNVSGISNLNSVTSSLFVGNASGLSNVNSSNLIGTIPSSILPSTGVTAGLYGSGANVSSINVDQYGRIVSAANIGITASQWTSNTGNTIYYANNVGIGDAFVPTSNLHVIGNIYATNSVTTTNIFFVNTIQDTNLPTTAISPGYYGSSANVPQILVDTYGRLTYAANVPFTASSQWTSISGNVAYQNGVSIGTISNPPNGSNLYVLGTANIEYINVYGLISNISNITLANISNLTVTLSNIATANLSNITIRTLANIANANVTSSNISTCNVTNLIVRTTANIANANVTTGNVTNLTVRTLANLTTANASTLTSINARFVNFNVLTTSNMFDVDIITANIVTTNTSSIFSLYSNLGIANASSIFSQNSNLGVANAYSVSSQYSNLDNANIVTANMSSIFSQNSNLGVANAYSVSSQYSNLDNANIVTANMSSILSENSNLGVANAYSFSSQYSNLDNANIVTANTSSIFSENSNLGVSNAYSVSSQYSNLINANIFASNVTTLNVSDQFLAANIYTSNTVTTVNDVFAGPVRMGRGANLVATDTVIGTDALINDTGSYDTAIGYQTMQNAQPSSGYDTAVGANALQNDTGVGYNTSVGAYSMQNSNPGGGFDTAMGHFALASDSGPGYNTAIGGQAMQGANPGGGYDTAVGWQALQNDTGSYNTGIGANAGQGITGGQYNTAIGAGSGPYSGSLSNTTSIGSNAHATSSDVAVFPYGVNVGINTSAPTATLEVIGNVYVSNSITTPNLTVTSNIISADPNGNTYLTGNLVVSGNVFSTLGMPLGSGGGYYFSLPSDIALQTPYTGALYGTTYPLSVGLSNGFTINGTSTLITVTTNGNFRFNTAGPYLLRAVFNSTDNIRGLAVGSNVADVHGTDQAYLYRYTTFITQNPTELIEIPFNITDTTKYYYLDFWSVDGGILRQTANTSGGTYLTITPLQGGGLATGGPGGTPGTQWISSGSDIYFPNSVGIGSVNPAYNLDVTTGTAAAQRIVTSNITSLGLYGPALNINSNVIITANLAIGGLTSTAPLEPPYALTVYGQGYFSNHVTYENFSGFRNRLVNGTFRVASRANTLTISNASTYNSNAWVCDRWRADVGNLATSNVLVTVKQDLPVGVTNGFTQCANVHVSRAWGATLDNTWICPLTQTVEASFAFDLKFGTVTAKPTVFTFWANTNVTGDYSVVIRSRNDNTYFANLVHMVSGSNWNRYTVYMPPCYIGSWGSGTAGYMDVCIFGVSYGTGRSSVALTTDWTASPGYAPMACTGATNWAQTLGAYIQVTGPQLEQGTVSTPFEVRPLSDTVRYCQRFYETNPQTQYAAALISGHISTVPFVVSKRGNANVSVYTTLSNLTANTNISNFTSITNGGSYANTAITSYISSEYGFIFNFTQGTGSNKIDEAQFVWRADAEIY